MTLNEMNKVFPLRFRVQLSNNSGAYILMFQSCKHQCVLNSLPVSKSHRSFPNLHFYAFISMHGLLLSVLEDIRGVFLHWFRLNMLSIKFRFMLSNICYCNKNQKSFLKLKWANFSAIVYIAAWIHVMFDLHESKHRILSMKKIHVMIYAYA